MSLLWSALPLVAGCADIHVRLLDSAELDGLIDSADTAGAADTADSADPDTATGVRTWAPGPGVQLANLPPADAARLLVGDVDLDGALDLLHLSHPGSGSTRISRWSAAAGGPVTEGGEVVASQVTSSVLADTDGDGRPELFAADNAGFAQYPFEADGTLGEASRLGAVPFSVLDLVATDLTGDGLDDVAVVSWSATPVDVTLYSAHGGALRALASTGVPLASVAGAWAAPRPEGGASRLVLGNAVPDASAWDLTADPDADPVLVVRDIGLERPDGNPLLGLVPLDSDGDGTDELLLAAWTRLSLYDPSTRTETTLTTGDAADAVYAVAPADLEGDGDQDAVVLHQVTESTDHSTSTRVGLAAVRSTAGGLELGERVLFDAGPYTSAFGPPVAVVDLDLDGCADVAFIDASLEPWLATGICNPE